MGWRGMGAGKYADGSHDVLAFSKKVIGQKLFALNSLLMLAAISQSSIRYDVSGNMALNKLSHRSRIDALQCSVIAVGLGTKLLERLKARNEGDFQGAAENPE